MMETIERKTLLYKSGLGFWCINHVQGCAHGCRYPCYAFMMARSHGRAKSMEEWCRPRLVANALPLLEREIVRKRGVDQVHFCLTTDPFMVGFPDVAELTLQLVEAINRRGIPCSLLTKGILPRELSDHQRFSPHNIYGISIVSLDERFRKQWEPGAAPYADRVAAARALHERGCQTRAHVEPYPTPNIITQDLGELLRSLDFVDHLYFSGWNYNPRASDYPERDAFYAREERSVQAFCRKHGITM